MATQPMHEFTVAKLPVALRQRITAVVGAAKEEAYKIRLRGVPSRSTFCEVFSSNTDFRKEALPETDERKCPIDGRTISKLHVQRLIDNYCAANTVRLQFRIVHFGCGNYYTVLVSDEAAHVWLDNRCTGHGMIPCGKDSTYDSIHTYGSWCRFHNGQHIS